MLPRSTSENSRLTVFHLGAPVEAMACGLPVVVTDVGGAGESLPPGHGAFGLVPPEDPAALAAALVTLLTKPELRQSLGRQAQDPTRVTRDVRTTAAAVCGLYQELLQHVPLGPPRPAGKRRP
ncbi:glycosyltransferase [Streptomyces sp. CA-135486]|uniref:glycosyltransferase n=1 Tax=Streptomyces sp. CA-135486 TaxID=3240049 RepID=UPI003D8CF776